MILPVVAIVFLGTVGAQMVFRTDSISDETPLPYIGNGNLATTVFSEEIFIQGHYTGHGKATRRAALPSTLCGRVQPSGAKISYALWVEQGYFETIAETSTYLLTQKLYAHSRIPEVLVNEYFIERKSGVQGELRVPLDNKCGFNAGSPTTGDFTFETATSITIDCRMERREAKGQLRIPANGSPQNVYVIWNHGEDFILTEDQQSRKESFLTAIAENRTLAYQRFEEARRDTHNLCNIKNSDVTYTRHTDYWALRMNSARISFQGSDPSASGLSHASFASMYYLLSSFPDHPFYKEDLVGFSAGSLASQFRNGHVSWEQEMYVFPPLLLLYPEAANQIITNRVNQLAKAQANAQASGRQNPAVTKLGAKYPYATIDGSELWTISDGDKVDHLKAKYPTGAVALALRQYLQAVPASHWKQREQIWDTVANIALRFQSSIQTTGNKTGIVSSVAPLQPFQEGGYAQNYVFNHALTHALAANALTLPPFLVENGLSGQDSGDIASTGEALAHQLHFPRNDSSPGEHFSHSLGETKPSGTLVPVPGAASSEPDLLLAYLPVRHSEFDVANCAVVRGDLEQHVPLPNGSRSVYPVIRHAIQLLASKSCGGIPRPPVADLLHAATGPFHIIPETNVSPPGSLQNVATNPLSAAGHGAFLQSVLNGYAGLELKDDRLIVDPIIPDGSDAFTISGLDYKGFVLDLKFTREEIQVRINIANHAAALYVETRLGEMRNEVKHIAVVKRSQISLIVQPKADNHWSRDPWLWESHTLPEQKYMPEVGNGHVATMINSSWIFMNRLYNGLGPKSSRARIPSLIGFNVNTNHSQSHLVQTNYSLNVHEGIFRISSLYRSPAVLVEQEVYAHRNTPSLLVRHVKVSRKDPSSEAVQIVFTNIPDQDQLLSDDLVFSATVLTTGGFHVAEGRNRIAEVANTSLSPVTVAWSTNIGNFVLGRDSTVAERTMIVSIDTAKEDAVEALRWAAGQSASDLAESHRESWESLWNNGRIEVDAKENFELAQGLHGSFYYLLASLPNKENPKNPFIGLSPGGLARGAVNTDYSGHIFWDTETWMYPPVLYFHPDQAKLLVKARTNTLDAARRNAKLYGYEGAKFAWESAYSGEETSPWPPSGMYELHITGDIAFAVQQLLYATDNKMQVIEELNLEAMANDMARFWQSRTTCNDTQCSILGVMPPDEYHFPIDNSVYTNYVAKVSLELPEYVSKFTGRRDIDLDKWKETARKLVFLRGIKDGKEYHVEFDGYEPGVWNPHSNVNDATIKQGDAILLGFPLDMPMDKTIRANDLDIYRPVTDEKGPAMTWGMFAVGYLELGRRIDADLLFEKNYENIVQPFGVWSEVSGGEGALNFITGMGGFLQAVVNGYGGLRLRADTLLLDPQPMPGTTKWKFVGYKHLGHQIDIGCDSVQNTMTFNVTSRSSSTRLVLTVDSGAVYDLSTKVGELVTVTREKAVIHASPDTTTPRPSPPQSATGASGVVQFSVINLCVLLLASLIRL